MSRLGVWGTVLASAMSLAACGGGGGGGSGTPSVTPTSATSVQLTVNVDPACPIPSNGYVNVTPANAPSTSCAAGVFASGSNQSSVTVLYGNGSGYCPANTALEVSAATTSCGTLTNSYIPGQSTTITLSPANKSAFQQFVGNWSLSYQCHCGDSGSCSMPIDSTGHIVNGSCTDAEKGPFAVTGAVDANGHFSGGGSSNGDVFSGTLTVSPTSKAGSGTWFLPNSSDSGPWAASAPAP